MTDFQMIPKTRAPGREIGWYTRESIPVSPGDRRTWLSVDAVALTTGRAPALILSRRGHDPHAGELALPGAVMDASRSLTVADTARETVQTRAGAQTLPGVTPHPVAVVSEAGRDERGHTVSLVCLIRVGTDISPAVDVELVRIGDALPPMPFGHTTMVRDAARWALDGLFTDVRVTRALLGTSTLTMSTGPEIHALVGLLHHLAGRDPETAPSLNAVRMKMARSEVIVEGGKAPARTRPEILYRSAE